MKCLNLIADWVVRRPVVTLGAALLVAAASLLITLNLRFDSNFAALLPENDPMVQEMDNLRERAGGTVDLIIAIRNLGELDEEKRLAFARRLVKKLRQQRWIRNADVEFPVGYFRERQLWLVTLSRLKHLNTLIGDEIERAKARANALFVDLDDEAPWERLRRFFTSRLEEAEGRLFEPVLTSVDKKYLIVRVRPMGSSIDIEAGRQTLERIKGVVADLDPTAAGVTLRYTGRLPINDEQNTYMQMDLRNASMTAFAIILLVLILYTRRVLAPLIIAVPLLVGLMVTLAVTTLVLGQLNLVSGFLISALLGIGVDFGIHLYLRYIEFLRLKKYSRRRQAMRDAMASNFRASATAAVTTTAAFIVLLLSDFRGFREYGAIASYGVFIALITTYLVLPPLAMILTKRPAPEKQHEIPPHVPFRSRFAIVMVVVGLVYAILGTISGTQVRFHNEFKKLQGSSPAVRFANYMEKSLGGSMSPAIIAVKDVEEARTVASLIQERKKRNDTQFGQVISLANLVPNPAQFAERRKLLSEIREKIDSVPLKDLSATDRDRVEELRSATTTDPWQVEDIPPIFRRLFSTLDGKLTFVLSWPQYDMSLDKNIITWSAALAELRQAAEDRGIATRLVDENVIAGRVLDMIMTDGPYVVAMALFAVGLFVLIDLRSVRQTIPILVAIGVGFVWAVGGMGWFGVNLNVFNIAIIPTIFGLGVDNAVHVYHRYKQEGRGMLGHVVATTGAAGLLCSLTTLIGFGTAVIAHHRGIQSMGQLAILGFTSVFAASAVFFPSLLRVLELRRSRSVQAESERLTLAEDQ